MSRGALGVVLYLSRVAGVAPFLTRGNEFRVSLPLNVYQKMFAFLFVINYVVVAKTSNLFYGDKNSALSFEILRIISGITAVLTLLVAIFTSPGRSMRILRFLQKLDEIDTEILGRDYGYKANERILIVFILSYLHVTLAMRCYDFFLILLSYKSGNIIVATFLLLLAIALYMITLSEFQLALFARRTMFSVKVIINTLENIDCRPFKRAWEKTNVSYIQSIKTKLRPVNFRTRLSSLNYDQKGKLVKIEESSAKLIRQCITNYMSICDIITETTHADGILLVLIILYHILNILSNAYKCIVYLASATYVGPNVLTGINQSIIHFGTILLFMEFYHRTQSEMIRLHCLLRSLKWKNLDKIGVSNELNLFWRVINMNKATYTPLGMFTLNRLFVLKIFGTLVTSLVIIVTYGSRINKH